MPVNEKILFRSFQYLFSLKSLIYAILSSAMLREKHAVFLGKKYRFPRGGGGINIRFRPKYRPLRDSLIVIRSTVPYGRRLAICCYWKFFLCHYVTRTGSWEGTGNGTFFFVMS
jgi:hypothetical protein